MTCRFDAADLRLREKLLPCRELVGLEGRVFHAPDDECRQVAETVDLRVQARIEIARAKQGFGQCVQHEHPCVSIAKDFQVLTVNIARELRTQRER